MLHERPAPNTPVIVGSDSTERSEDPRSAPSPISSWSTRRVGSETPDRALLGRSSRFRPAGGWEYRNRKLIATALGCSSQSSLADLACCNCRYSETLLRHRCRAQHVDSSRRGSEVPHAARRDHGHPSSTRSNRRTRPHPTCTTGRPIPVLDLEAARSLRRSISSHHVGAAQPSGLDVSVIPTEIARSMSLRFAAPQSPRCTDRWRYRS